MINSKITIHEYLTKDGDSPFGTWLSKLKDKKSRAIVRTRLDRVKLGNCGDFKSIGDSIYELRIHYGEGYRIYYGRDGDALIILLCGGTKKTQKKDIIKAKEYWNDYKRRLYG